MDNPECLSAWVNILEGIQICDPNIFAGKWSLVFAFSDSTVAVTFANNGKLTIAFSILFSYL